MFIDLNVTEGVGTITINRPEKLNALTFEMRETLADIFEQFSADSSVRAVLLRGAGSSFCTGADVNTMQQRNPSAVQQRMRHSHRMIVTLHQMEKPVIGAVQGIAAGIGWSLILCCDIVIASENARFSQIFRRIGLAPDGGAVWFLTHQVGSIKARELVMSGRFMSAAEALGDGLVSEIVPEMDLGARATALASEYAKAPTLALGLSKRLLNASITPSLEKFLESELIIQPKLMSSYDHMEGRTAFREKRRAHFLGR